MNNKLIKKYVWKDEEIKTHKEDGDCRLATFLGLVRYYKADVTINELFGIGCGLDFTLMDVPAGSINILGVTGRNFEVEKNFCEKINITIKESISTYKPKRFWDKPFDYEILSEVANGRPVVVNTDIYYMDYLSDKNLPHNRYHCIMILGYDLKAKTLQVVDAMTDKIETLQMSSLNKGIHQQGKFMMEEGLWYVIKDNNDMIKEIPKSMYIDSLIEQSKYMLSDDGPISQIKDFYEFLQRTYNKAIKSEDNKYKNYLTMQVSTICSLIRTEDEVSGTFYRRLYLRFVQRFIEKFEIKNENMDKIVEMLTEDAGEWKKIAFKVRYTKDILEQTKKLIEALEKIYNLEKNIFELILKENL